MPKPSNNKKRKRDKKQDEERGAKKAKSKDEGVEEDLSAELNDAELPGATKGVLDDIDEILEENAARNNLTAINVKSILHVSLYFSQYYLRLNLSKIAAEACNRRELIGPVCS